jgi:hypothetical protein
MRIAYIGNFIPAHSTENHLAESFRSIGHHVIEFQENAQQHRVDTIADRVLDVEPDLVLYTKTWGLPLECVDQWRKIEADGVPTASFHLDLYAGLDRESQISSEPFWRTQFVFTADGGSADVFDRYGIDHEWIRPGVFRPECVPGVPLQKYSGLDVGFVGSHLAYHREWPYRVQLVKWLRARFRGRCAILPTRVQVRGIDLNDLYASVPVFVGDSLCPGFTHERYWSDRVYETVGRGGFIIHPRIAGLELDFIDGEHLRFYDYRDLDTLGDMIRHYARHPDEAHAIAMAGQEHVRANHTYEHRALELLELLDAKGAL